MRKRGFGHNETTHYLEEGSGVEECYNAKGILGTGQGMFQMGREGLVRVKVDEVIKRNRKIPGCPVPGPVDEEGLSIQVICLRILASSASVATYTLQQADTSLLALHPSVALHTLMSSWQLTVLEIIKDISNV